MSRREQRPAARLAIGAVAVIGLLSSYD